MDISALNTYGLINRQNDLTPSVTYSRSTDAVKTNEPTDALIKEDRLTLTLSDISKIAFKAEATAYSCKDQSVINGMEKAIDTLISKKSTDSAFSTFQDAVSLADTDPETFRSIFRMVNTFCENKLGSIIKSYLSAAVAVYQKSGAAAVANLNKAFTSALANTDTSETIAQAISKIFQQDLPA